MSPRALNPCKGSPKPLHPLTHQDRGRLSLLLITLAQSLSQDLSLPAAW